MASFREQGGGEMREKRETREVNFHLEVLEGASGVVVGCETGKWGLGLGEGSIAPFHQQPH